MTDFKYRYGPWALVTGASAGIGAEFATQLAALGLNLILVARRHQRLQKLAEELESKHKIQTRIISIDLSRPDFLPEIIAATEGLDVGLLVKTTPGSASQEDS
jgi:short-subunit dehydrogenase